MTKEKSGIAMISSRKLDVDAPPTITPTTTATTSQVYTNQAFDSNSYDKEKTTTSTYATADAPAPTTASGASDAPANTAAVTAPSTTASANNASAPTGLYDEISESKKSHAHGSVEFSMPDKRRESRLKSFSSEGPYRGMGKEELLRYSSRPLWRNLRYACISIVLMGWLALLITVVALILTYPPCSSRGSLTTAWWQKTVIYRIYVPSFQDGEKGDGLGDIAGIRDRLDYIQSIGADTISLSPIYEMGDDDTNYDIVNHTAIDQNFGTLDQFKQLLNETHSRGMHLILDFIPNHTSQKHPWFEKSASDPNPRTNEFRSYYVWTQGNSPINNWKSVYSCPAWTQFNNTDNYYLHQFKDSHPDLNLRSDKVKDELQKILLFWLELGVDGFYIRDTDFLFEDYDMRDEEIIENSAEIETPSYCNRPPGNTYGYNSFNHKYTKGLSQNFDLVARWRKLLDTFGEETKRYRVLIADVIGPIDHVMDYYGLFNRDGVDFPLNPFSHQLNVSKGGVEVGGMVSDWMKHMPQGRWGSWMTGDDSIDRLADRLGEKLARTYLMLIMLLPGTPFIYYGDEIGLRSSVREPGLEPWAARQPMRSLMLWSNETERGFCVPRCVNEPWMSPSSTQLDVLTQQDNKESIWNLFKNLTEFRKGNPSIEYGDFSAVQQDEDVYAFVREFDGEKGYLVALNFGSEVAKRTYTGTHSTIPGSATIELATQGAWRKGNSVSLDQLSLEPGEGLVLSWDYVAEEL